MSKNYFDCKSYSYFTTFTNNPITEVLREVSLGSITDFNEEIINICNQKDCYERISDLFNNLNFTNDIVFEPSDFTIIKESFGTIIKLPNAGIEDYSAIISLNNGMLLALENEIDGEQYLINLLNLDDGPLGCIKGYNNLKEVILLSA